MNHDHKSAWQQAGEITDALMAQHHDYIASALARNDDIVVLVEFEAGSVSQCVKCHSAMPDGTRFYRGAFIPHGGQPIFGDWCQRCAQRIIATTGNPVICHEIDYGPNEQTD